MVNTIRGFCLLAIGCALLLGGGCNKPAGPEIKLVSPLVGPYTAGSIVTIRWTINAVTDVKEAGIKLSTDNGQTFTVLSTPFIPSGTTTYEWLVDSAQASTNCVIMVYNPDDPSLMDKSGSFKVQLQSPTKALELLSPLGSEIFPAGRTVLVKWKINDQSKVGSVGLELLMNNGATKTMIYDRSIPPDTTTYSWAITSDQVAGNCRIKVFEYHDNCDPDSSGLFTITN